MLVLQKLAGGRTLAGGGHYGSSPSCRGAAEGRRSTGGGAHVLGRALSLCTKPRALPCYPQLALTPVPVTDSKDSKEGLEGNTYIQCG